MQVDPEADPQIPWIVMTSDATDAPTRTFFEEKDYFGLDPSQVKPCPFAGYGLHISIACEHTRMVFELKA